MNAINFEQMKNMNVEDLNQMELQFSKMPEGFKLKFQKPVENYAEKLIEDLK